MKIDESQIIAYLKGELSPEEASALETWIAKSEGHTRTFERIEQLWRAAESEAPALPDVEDAWRSVRGKIRREAGRRRLGGLAWRVAAAVLFLLVAYGVWRYFLPGEAPPLEVVAEREMKVMELPDGSRVWLRPSSRLTFPERFAGNERRATLSGEAYFEVVSNPEKPFFIQSDEMEVKVLGTSFNLTAYPDSSSVSLQVNTGLVAFYPAGREEEGVRLRKGEMGIFDRPTRRVTKLDNSDPNLLAWQNGRLVFAQTTLEQVVETLERTFRVEIDLGDPNLAKCVFTGEFRSEKLETILNTLAFTLDLEVRTEDNIYILNGKGCL